MLSGEPTNINFIIFGLTRPELEPSIYHTRGEQDNTMIIWWWPRRSHYTTYHAGSITGVTTQITSQCWACWHFVGNLVGPTLADNVGPTWFCSSSLWWANSSMPTKSTIYELSASSFTKDIMLVQHWPNNNMLTKLSGATVAQWSRWLVKLLPVITVAIHHCSVGSSLSLVIVQNDQAWAWLAMTWQRVC